MKVIIIGNCCLTCEHYTQYYILDYTGEYEPIDRGFCGACQRETRPGNGCRKKYTKKEKCIGK